MKRSILFVCNGNVFRSMAAELAFKKHLAENNIKGWKVSSAGIFARKEPIDPKTIEVLKKKGVKSIRHKRKKLTKEMLKQHDIVVAMAKDQLEYIKNKLKHKYVLLFNELAIDKKTSVLDVEDEVKDHADNRKAVERKIERTIRNIFKRTYRVFKNASERFYLFEDFANGRKTHRNGYPLIKLYETENTFSFMSLDIPKKSDGHILVVPKKRYVELSEVPSVVLDELMVSVKKIGSVISAGNGGYNILLNNGIDAGQTIFHVHFHIVPRKSDDGIQIEVWNREHTPAKDFIRLNQKLKRKIYSRK
ncbi:MAG TPA: HIT domain-containing protein [Candidatus Woesearchaeota archaeon]|nr:HIT domain-containing protein [Candidatus Woesearchaeota archaeon]